MLSPIDKGMTKLGKARRTAELSHLKTQILLRVLRLRVPKGMAF
jgi:hypothetical protein